MQIEEIKSLLEEQITDCQAQVTIEGSHVHLVVVTPLFEGLSPVKKQQLVYGALSEPIASGAIHAVQMKTYTPQQWAELSSD